MRTQVYAALFAVVAAKTETAVEKKAAASNKTIADDITACHTGTDKTGNADDAKKCRWNAKSCASAEFMKYKNCLTAFPLAKDAFDSAIAHCAYGANGVADTDPTVDTATGEIITATKLNTSDEGKCAWKDMCATEKNYNSFNLCKSKFPLAETTFADGACYYDPKGTSCTWAMCSKDADTFASEGCKAKAPGLKAKATKAEGECAYDGKCTWKICQASDDSKKWAHCDTDCHSDPTKAGCFNPDDAKSNCLFGDKDAKGKVVGCSYDVCKDHQSDKAVAPPVAKDQTSVSAWDDHFYSLRCTYEKTQNYRLSQPNTRTQWTKVDNQDKSELKDIQAKTKGLKHDALDTEKCKPAATTATKAEKADATKACTDAKDAVDKNTADITKYDTWIKANNAWRLDHDKATWTANEITATRSTTSVEAAGTKLNDDANKRVTAAQDAAFKSKYITKKTDKACATAHEAEQECKVLVNDVAIAKLTAANIDNLYATKGTGAHEASTQPWFGTWNANAIKDAKTLADAKAAQAKNVSAHTAAAAISAKNTATLAEKSKTWVLEQYVTEGAKVIHDIDNQNVWHKALLAGDKTKAEIDATLAADKTSHGDAVTKEAAACKTDKTSPGCDAATKWTAMHADWITDDNKALKALTTTKTNAKKPTKAEAENTLTALKKDAKDAKDAVTATEGKIAKDCKTATEKADATCKALDKTLATEKTAETDANAAVVKQEALIKKDYGSSTVGIIIGCVAGVLCIGGGAAWYIKHKKASDEFDDVFTSFTQ